jgi:hypothetical protein
MGTLLSFRENVLSVIARVEPLLLGREPAATLDSSIVLLEAVLKGRSNRSHLVRYTARPVGTLLAK